MAPNFPIDESYLVGGWLESFLWGLYTLLFGMSLYTIYQKRDAAAWWRFTTISLVLSYVLASTHMILALVRLIQGFILYRDTIGTIKYFGNIPVPINKAKDYVYITSLFVGDLVVVWRLYVVWGKSWLIAALPVLFNFGELIAGYGALIQYELPHPNRLNMLHWGTAMFAMSLATNVIVTSAVALRIWYVTLRPRSDFMKDGGIHYTRLILLIIESGALITAAKIVEFVLFLVSPGNGRPGVNAMYIVYEAMPQITGIVPTMIIYAVNNGFTHREEHFATFKSTIVFRGQTAFGLSTGGMSSSVYASDRATTLASPSMKSMMFSENEDLKKARLPVGRHSSDGDTMEKETV